MARQMLYFRLSATSHRSGEISLQAMHLGDLRMFKKTLLSTALLSAFLAGNAYGATIGLSIDPNGSTAGGSGPQDVYNLNWQVGNAISVPDAGNVTDPNLQSACGGYSGPNSVVFTGSGTPCGTFTTYAQAALTSYGDIDNNPVAFSGTGSGNGEWTFVTKLREAITPTATGSNLFVLGIEYFEIWYDPTPDKNDLTGTGFSSAKTTNGVTTTTDDAIRILFTNTISGEGQNNGVFNRDIDPSTGLPRANVPLDGFGTNNYASVDSIQGNGSTTIRVHVNAADYDHSFFLTDTDFDFSIDFSTANKTPFNQTNPASCFYDTATGTWLGGAGNPTGTLGSGAPAGFTGCGNTVGATNGLSGPNVMFQTQSTASFFAAVPEPATVALLGAGLIGTVVSRRRSSKKN